LRVFYQEQEPLPDTLNSLEFQDDTYDYGQETLTKTEVASKFESKAEARPEIKDECKPSVKDDGNFESSFQSKKQRHVVNQFKKEQTQDCTPLADSAARVSSFSGPHACAPREPGATTSTRAPARALSSAAQPG
jgi:hypothetical protein